MKKTTLPRLTALLAAGLLLWSSAALTGCDTPAPGESGTPSQTDPAATQAPTEPETPEDTQPMTVGTSGLQFLETFEGNYEICAYKGTETHVVIPPSHNGKPVERINSGAFSRENTGDKAINDEIVSVEIPDSVTSIGIKAFLGCHKLESIHIPASVTSIEPNSFQECTGLKTITVDKANPNYRAEGNCLIEIATGTVLVGCSASVIPDDGSIKAISPVAFFQCTTLTEIRIPASVTELPRNAFKGCTALTRVEGCEGLVTVGWDAFRDCAALTEFPFVESLRVIGQQAFYNCDALTEVTLPREMETLGVEAFGDCGGLTRLELPAALAEMGFEVIGGSSLTALTIPEGYTRMNSLCSNARDLRTVYLPITLTAIADTEFSFCYGLTDIHFAGTLEQWLAITPKDQTWMGFVEEWTLHCSDGVTQWEYVDRSGMKQVS